MDDSQPWYASRTVWASIVTIIGSILVMYGLDLSLEVREALVTLLVVAGPSVAIWGRFAARRMLRWR